MTSPPSRQPEAADRSAPSAPRRAKAGVYASEAALAWAAWLAFAGVGMTTLLITLGGLVTNTDSGLACPDWPTCFGTPFPKMVGGVLLEHGHRYLATAVGFVSVLCVWLAGRGAPRLVSLLVSMPLILGAGTWAGIARHRTFAVPPAAGLLVLAGYAAGLWAVARARGAGRLAQVALLLVISQGLLGGLTVMYQLPVTVLVLHTGTSMIFLSVQLWLALRLRQEAHAAGSDTAGAGAGPGGPRAPRAPREIAEGTPAPSFGELLARAGGARLVTLAGAAVYLQILLGATVRHTGAGLVCTDLPWCKGALWPMGVHPAVHLHMVHRTFALVAGALVVLAGLRAARAAGEAGERGTRLVALALPALVAAQLALGVLTIWSLKELWTVTAHLLVAGLLLAGCVALWARARLTLSALAVSRGPATPAPGRTGAALAAQGRTA